MVGHELPRLRVAPLAPPQLLDAPGVAARLDARDDEAGPGLHRLVVQVEAPQGAACGRVLLEGVHERDARQLALLGEREGLRLLEHHPDIAPPAHAAPSGGSDCTR